MDHWEFLLQQEGDRSWLPLESPDVEILEGRYRIVARSNRPNTKVDIRVTHLATQEDPPKRRVQKRSHQTNQTGLMVVFPFTRLKPGLWEIRCACDIMSDMLGNSWQQTVRLQVLPRDLESGVEWEPEWSPPLPAPEVPVLSAPVTPPPEPEEVVAAVAAIEAEPEPSPPVPPIAASEPIPEPSLPQPEPLFLSPAAALAIAPHLELTLEQAAWMIPWGQPFTLVGQVSAAVEAPIWGGNLHISLRDPQTAQAIVELQQQFPVQPLPLSFQITLEIPHDCESHLLLGELNLYQSPDLLPEAEVALFTTPFTVTADLTALLGVIAEDFTEPDLVGLPLESSIPPTETPEKSTPASGKSASPLNLNFLNLVETPKPTLDFKPLPTNQSPLPPQIYRPDPDQLPTKASVQLPRLTPPGTPPQNPADTSSLDSDAIAELDLSDLELDSGLPESLDSTTNAVSENPNPEPVSEDFSPFEETVSSPWDSEPEPEPEPLPEPDPETELESEFQSLNLQARFLSRLTDLATDTELSEWLKAEVAPEPIADPEPELSLTEPELPETLELSEEPDLLAEPDSEQLALEVPEPEVPLFDPFEASDTINLEIEDPWLAQEIVVDDEPIASSPTLAGPEPAIIPDILMDEEESIPTPVLEVPDGDLVAGRTINIRATIPMLPSRIYIKFWISDLQTRSLLDGPRWLVDFTPNGQGDQEVIAQVTVPPGGLEIQFSAIAVEMHTQRESHKASCDRTVIPPDLPLISLEELEGLE